MSFSSLGLCDELSKAVSEQGYTSPSPIQAEAIPAVLNQRDVLAIAQTGTGKTAAFTLPVLQLLLAKPKSKTGGVRALIITPTRELAAQVAASLATYSRHVSISSAPVFGGERIEPQMALLQSGVDVLVATPGRLLDLYKRQAVDLNQVELWVLDEADRMLELGFIDAIRRIQTLLPSQRQTLMFSATLSEQISSLTASMLTKPINIEITAANSVVESIKQTLYPVVKDYKTDLLSYLIKINRWPQVLVFCRTKRGADELVTQLNNAKLSADSIHANRTQHARTLALEGFKTGSIRVLVATDIASRGIDINQLACVVNYDLPYVAEDYVHRIGRTGRVGRSGVSISFFSDDEAKQLAAIEQMLGHKIEREIVAGFAPLAKPSSSFDDDEFGNFEADVDAVPRRGSKRNGKPTRKRRR
jgi:ATP-dependent RNA helicase RhlE